MLYFILLLLLEISELEFVIAFGVFIFFLLAIFTALFLIVSYKRKIKYKEQLIKFNFEKQQELLQTQIEIQEQTLKTISEEIHDNIGQVLSLAKLHLNTFPTSIDEATQTKVADTKQLVSKAINDLRDLSRSLHGEKISEIGLYAAIENELRILQNTKQFETSFDIIGEQYKMESQKEMVLFRILQESLNNAVKYSNAKKIVVKLDYGKVIFRLTITDNGVGFDIAALQLANTGIGLKNMQNRAVLIGGKFFIHSIADSGTNVIVELATNNLQP